MLWLFIIPLLILLHPKAFMKIIAGWIVLGLIGYIWYMNAS